LNSSVNLKITITVVTFVPSLSKQANKDNIDHS
jgi:hypothetical protein